MKIRALLILVAAVLPAAAHADTVCQFQAKYHFGDSNTIDISVKDSGTELDSKHLAFFSKDDAETTCADAVKELEKYEKAGTCKVIWSGVESQLNKAFPSWRYPMPSCMGRVKSHEPVAANSDPSVSSQMATMRRRLGSVLGAKAVSLISDDAVMLAMQNLFDNKFNCQAAAKFEFDDEKPAGDASQNSAQ